VHEVDQSAVHVHHDPHVPHVQEQAHAEVQEGHEAHRIDQHGQEVWHYWPPGGLRKEQHFWSRLLSDSSFYVLYFDVIQASLKTSLSLALTSLSTTVDTRHLFIDSSAFSGLSHTTKKQGGQD
jgi:hypothetical protein